MNKISKLKTLNENYAITLKLKSGRYLCIYAETEEIKEIDIREYYRIERKYDMIEYAGYSKDQMKEYLIYFKK